jgi:hypothetical protein
LWWRWQDSQWQAWIQKREAKLGRLKGFKPDLRTPPACRYDAPTPWETAEKVIGSTEK